MALIENVRDFKAFQEAYVLAVELRPLLQEFPKTEQIAGIASQMRRASTGICANLAEGFGKRQSRVELLRFVRMARGSVEEMDVWLSFSADFGYLQKDLAQSLRDRYQQVCKLLNGFERSVNKLGNA